MDAKKTRKGPFPRGPLPLTYLAFYAPVLVNFALVVLFQVLFVHTLPGPVVSMTIAGDIRQETLSAQPYFAGCTILDSYTTDGEEEYGPGMGWRMDLGSGRSLLVLFRDAEGRQMVARVDKNLLFDRWGIVEHATAPVEGGAARVKSYLGHYDITVEQDAITDVQPELFVRSISLFPFFAMVGVACLLYGAETGLLALVRRRRQSPPPG